MVRNVYWIHKREEYQQNAHSLLINLFQLYYPLHVSNKQVHHQEVTSVHAACSISVFLIHLWSV